MIKIILPIVFISYVSCISFFTHTHIINGVTIVHSHPFLKDSQGNPDHTHTSAEVQLIQILSSYQTGDQIVPIILLSALCCVVAVLFIKNSITTAKQNFKEVHIVRPPPYFFS